MLTKSLFCGKLSIVVAKTTHFEKTWKKFKKSVDKVFAAMYNKQARSERAAIEPWKLNSVRAQKNLNSFEINWSSEWRAIYGLIRKISCNTAEISANIRKYNFLKFPCLTSKFSLLKLFDLIRRKILDDFDAEVAAGLTPCKTDKLKA